MMCCDPGKWCFVVLFLHEVQILEISIMCSLVHISSELNHNNIVYILSNQKANSCLKSARLVMILNRAGVLEIWIPHPALPAAKPAPGADAG